MKHLSKRYRYIFICPKHYCRDLGQSRTHAFYCTIPAQPLVLHVVTVSTLIGLDTAVSSKATNMHGRWACWLQ